MKRVNRRSPSARGLFTDPAKAARIQGSTGTLTLRAKAANNPASVGYPADTHPWRRKSVACRPPIGGSRRARSSHKLVEDAIEVGSEPASLFRALSQQEKNEDTR